MSKPSTHLFEVELTFDGLETTDASLDVSLPNWRSGRYLIFDFASGVVEFDATNASSGKLRWRKTDKSTWRIETLNATTVHIRYKVFANEFNLRTRGLNDERGFVDGSAVFMYAEKHRWLPLTLTVVPFGTWHVTTGLDSVAGEWNKFTAPHYDHLADCPLEIGSQKDLSFTVRNKEHVLSIAGHGNYDSEKLIKDISTIVEAHATFWEDVPYERFVFLLSLSPSGGGGTEHINSCVMNARPFVFKNPESYESFLGLVSHEFFHTWNVKQLRPAAINTYDWSKESYTKELWIAEGTTSYLDGVLLVRAGCLPESRFLEQLAGAVERSRSHPGNLRQSLSECSFDAWIKFWKNTKQAVNFETDYYARGADVSCVLDLTMRQRTRNKQSLDDVMREMYKRFPMGKGGYTTDDFKRVCETIAGSSFQQFFDDYVDGMKPLPWEECLAYAGLELKEKSPEKKPWLGLSTADEGERTKVTRIIAGSPAYEAGVDVEDIVVALDGYKIRTATLNSRIAEMKDGEKVTLTVFRDERLRNFEITLRVPDITPLNIVKSEKPSALQKNIFASWLSVSPDKKAKR